MDPKGEEGKSNRRNLFYLAIVSPIFGIILTGCGSRGYWTKSEIQDRGYVTEADKEQFRKDVFECRVEAHLAADRFILADFRKYPEIHWRRQCFMLRGWEWREGKPPHESYYLLR